MVVLTSIPPGLLDGLPQEDQNAIVAIVGKPVLLVEYENGQVADRATALSLSTCRYSVLLNTTGD